MNGTDLNLKATLADTASKSMKAAQSNAPADLFARSKNRQDIEYNLAQQATKKNNATTESTKTVVDSVKVDTESIHATTTATYNLVLGEFREGAARDQMLKSLRERIKQFRIRERKQKATLLEANFSNGELVEKNKVQAARIVSLEEENKILRATATNENSDDVNVEKTFDLGKFFNEAGGISSVDDKFDSSDDGGVDENAAVAQMSLRTAESINKAFFTKGSEGRARQKWSALNASAQQGAPFATRRRQGDHKRGNLASILADDT